MYHVAILANAYHNPVGIKLLVYNDAFSVSLFIKKKNKWISIFCLCIHILITNKGRTLYLTNKRPSYAMIT